MLHALESALIIYTRKLSVVTPLAGNIESSNAPVKLGIRSPVNTVHLCQNNHGQPRLSVWVVLMYLQAIFIKLDHEVEGNIRYPDIRCPA